MTEIVEEGVCFVEIISASSENRSLGCKWWNHIERNWKRFNSCKYDFDLEEGRHPITVSIVCSLLTSVFTKAPSKRRRL